MIDEPIAPPSGPWPDGKPWWAGSAFCGRRLEGDQWLIVIPLIGGRSRICVCSADDATIEGYCMHNVADGLLGYVLWPEVPANWSRHMTKHGNEYPT